MAMPANANLTVVVPFLVLDLILAIELTGTNSQLMASRRQMKVSLRGSLSHPETQRTHHKRS